MHGIPTRTSEVLGLTTYFARTFGLWAFAPDPQGHASDKGTRNYEINTYLRDYYTGGMYKA